PSTTEQRSGTRASTWLLKLCGDAAVAVALAGNPQRCEARGACKGFVVCGDHAAGAVFASLLKQQVHDLPGIERVQRRSGFIRQ
nr:hypothetical protein [Tanacetum cinerariifolium]